MICRTCRGDYPKVVFGATANGVRRQCADCYAAYLKGCESSGRRVRHPRSREVDIERTEKLCCVCNTSLPVTNFHNRYKAGVLVGYSTYCKSCDKQRARAYYATSRGKENIKRQRQRYRAKYPEKVKANIKAWMVKHPEYERLRYHRRKLQPGFLAMRAACIRRWYAKNPWSERARKHRRRLRMQFNGGAGVSAGYMQELLSSPCSYCGGVAVAMDHVVPVAHGGQHDPTNVVPTCKSCNSSKSDTSLLLWLVERANRAVR